MRQNFFIKCRPRPSPGEKENVKKNGKIKNPRCLKNSFHLYFTSSCKERPSVKIAGPLFEDSLRGQQFRSPMIL